MGTYRRTIGPLVEADAVVEFVFREPMLPRSVRFCLDGIRRELVPLNNHKDALKVLDRSRRSLSRLEADTAKREELHAFIDQFQLELNRLGNLITSSWFMPRMDLPGVDTSGVDTSGVDTSGVAIPAKS